MNFNFQVGDLLVNFFFKGSLTLCSIMDTEEGVVISTAHTVMGAGEEYDPVVGAKYSLERALDTKPHQFFDKETRSLVWEEFWATVDDLDEETAVSEIQAVLEKRLDKIEEILSHYL